MSADKFTQSLFAQFARVGKALANGHRLLLLELLAQGPRNVDALARAAGISVPNTSQHLQQLKDAGLVAGRKCGQHVIYRHADPGVLELLAGLRKLAAGRLTEVRRMVHAELGRLDEDDPIGAVQLRELMRIRPVTVVDVRPEEEFEAGHIPGAMSVPLRNMAEHLACIPQEQDVVVYCRGSYCALSYEAVDLLRDLGYKARRLADGFPEWKRRGFSVADGDSELRVAS